MYVLLWMKDDQLRISGKLLHIFPINFKGNLHVAIVVELT